LGRIITAKEAMEWTVSMSISDESDDNAASPVETAAHGKKGTSSEENSKASLHKRKPGDGGSNSGSDRAAKAPKVDSKTVTFSQKSEQQSSSGIVINEKSKNKSKVNRKIGTRSTRSGEVELVQELPVKKIKKKHVVGKRIKKSDDVTVVQMLTGTLYLYRGSNPHAEFVRSKG